MSDNNAPAGEPTPIRRALLSVSDKTGLIDFAQKLADMDVQLISTGGTSRALREAGLEVTDISELTAFPEMMDGRVKTLHPAVHGGLLARRDDAGHMEALTKHGYMPIDMLVVNLYPFEEAVLQDSANFDTCIENIDIGGPALIRAAAKNHKDVAVLTDPDDYTPVLEALQTHNREIPVDMKRRLASEAFARTAAYDAAISAWFRDYAQNPWPRHYAVGGKRHSIMRYGENPHQSGALYTSALQPPGVPQAEKIQGKDLSYNNVFDASAAWSLAADLARIDDREGCVIIKHANPCGVALHTNQETALARAVSCDPVSAFGGILAFSHPLKAVTAEAITESFYEAVVAPDYSEQALEILARKPNLRILRMPEGALQGTQILESRQSFRSVEGGVLMQDSDSISDVDFRQWHTVTRQQAGPECQADMYLAWCLVRHVASNAVVFVKDGMSLGIGAGQMSRLDSTRIAIQKAGDAELDLNGSVAASDAFYPFPDAMEKAAEAGAAIILHPGGSRNDEEVIARADQLGKVMIITGRRHFRH